MTPLERAAQTIHDCLDLQLAHMTGREMVNDGTVARGIARAVLTAIREPGEGILKAMRDTVPVDGHEWEYRDEEAVTHWQAMIDAALAEGE